MEAESDDLDKLFGSLQEDVYNQNSLDSGLNERDSLLLKSLLDDSDYNQILPLGSQKQSDQSAAPSDLDTLPEPSSVLAPDFPTDTTTLAYRQDSDFFHSPLPSWFNPALLAQSCSPIHFEPHFQQLTKSSLELSSHCYSSPASISSSSMTQQPVYFQKDSTSWMASEPDLLSLSNFDINFPCHSNPSQHSEYHSPQPTKSTNISSLKRPTPFFSGITGSEPLQISLESQESDLHTPTRSTLSKTTTRLRQSKSNHSPSCSDLNKTVYPLHCVRLDPVLETIMCQDPDTDHLFSCPFSGCASRFRRRHNLKCHYATKHTLRWRELLRHIERAHTCKLVDPQFDKNDVIPALLNAGSVSPSSTFTALGTDNSYF
ncbi:hypothetical protein BDEG_25796 [Batrachochytrium dendrobatidis JEL423]|uniref:C2H2-type domain-containing protein n=1 Tax=Batrachochytrium dendrobatidis (strain JEL423) TaxID=403673 RepID=A0A177WR12_BATDL|nr:hypothetical protein BDEG_25796 [Batrachochytrium dendrobatidis JEL423]